MDDTGDGTQTLDAIVIGANLRGLVTAYVLGSLGYRAVVLERGPHLGGADGSFVTPGSARFDHGLHLLDAMRSELATKLFSHVVESRVHELTLRRAIVLRNHILPYAVEPSAMPAELRDMLPGEELTDDIGDRLPTRDRLAEHYGPRYANMIFDEVLPSFRCEHRHRAFDVDESRLLTNIYPWFFPRATRENPNADESRRFHDRLRDGIPQRILYPREGGFGGYAEGFARHIAAHGNQVLTGIEDLELRVRPGTHHVERVDGGGRSYRARHYFWGAAWAPLCRALDIPCQDVATDRVLLGSLRLNRPALTDYHEILVGDPELRINRISFPARFRASEEPLLQVEYAFPLADEQSSDAETWRANWLTDLRRLNLLDAEHVLEEFDFRTFCMHLNAFGAEGEPLRDADPAAIHADSNLRAVVPSMANLNLNAYVPRVVADVTAVLAAERC